MNYGIKEEFMQLVVTKSNTLNALSWIKQGWRLFTLQPGPFMAMSAIIICVSLLANLNAILGIVVVFMMPFLSAGYYQCASRAEQGEKITPADIFYYLSHIRSHRVFIRLAFVSIVLSIPMTQVAVGVQESLLAGEMFDFASVILLLALLWLNFMLLAFALPAAWIAPETDIMTLVKQSFKACWINVMPLTLYGLIIFVLALISMPVILVGWLIMYSVSVLSFYQMFLSIYQPEHSVTTDNVVNDDEAVIKDVNADEDVASQDGIEKDHNSDNQSVTDDESVSKNNTPNN
ncbi:MAG: putative membrane protein [Psychrosphaera sp.]